MGKGSRVPARGEGLFDGDFDSKLRFCFALSARGSRIRIDGVLNKVGRCCLENRAYWRGGEERQGFVPLVSGV